MTEDQFKCLIFVCALKSPCDAEIRNHMLSIIEQNPDSTLRILIVVNQELERFQRSAVLQPLYYFARAAHIVAVLKAADKLRICAAFSAGGNAALGTHQYPLPVPEDFSAQLNGGNIFAKLDQSDTKLPIQVSEESRKLLTIYTHHGLFHFTCLPFGDMTGLSIFQKTIETVLTCTGSAAAYLNEIIINGSNPDEFCNGWRPSSAELRTMASACIWRCEIFSCIL
ncbi:unnamed protein product [Schistocephalus solidus]|uniref:UDP-Glycosyltransferase superfamily protein n=1 Tax=Schistocephalus solidus TaxID=70667 RepID=A0A183SGG7_SCHSO|nr:unnamed protein product [Schistocephalus solidus]